MYELWAKKRPVEGKGHSYEFICSFENESMKYSKADELDRSTYLEAMVTDGNGSAIFYKEFEKPSVKSLGAIPKN